jgi:RecJ-like exonuclease
MTKYLTPDSPDAFTDHPMMDPVQAAKYSLTKECPRCKGHGGWNLLLNEYPLHGKEDTAANRHKFSHFRASCSHCNGWGYVRADEMCAGHEWEFVRNTGRCLNLHKCKHCGKLWEIDSSD